MKHSNKNDNGGFEAPLAVWNKLLNDAKKSFNTKHKNDGGFEAPREVWNKLLNDAKKA